MYEFGKAISGGTPIGADEVRKMQVEHLRALKDQLKAPPPPLEKTEDVLSQRVAEELDYAKRLLELVEAEITRRGVPAPVKARLGEAEALIEDLADIVEAKDRCAGVERADAPGLKARLLRRGLEGEPVPCKVD